MLSENECKCLDDKLSKTFKTYKETDLNPKILVAYKRPQTIATWLTKYKIQVNEDNDAIGGSHLCGECLLRNGGGKGVKVKKKTGKLSKSIRI